MVGSLIIMAAALTGQPPGPADREAIGREAVPIVGQVAAATARAKARAAGEAAAPRADASKLIAKRRARKATAYSARLDREYREAVAAERAAALAKKEYKEMLPYMLENQRQMLDRQSQLERNQVLNRLAGAAERQAGYVYPGQSPTTGPYR